MGVVGKRSIRAVTLDLDDTLWPCEPTLLRAERLALEWLTERVPEIIAPWSIERLRERRMAIHAARPELKHDFVTIRRLALQEVFRAAGRRSASARSSTARWTSTCARGRGRALSEVRACSSGYRSRTHPRRFRTAMSARADGSITCQR